MFKKIFLNKFVLIGVPIIGFFVLLLLLINLAFSIFLVSSSDECHPVSESGDVAKVDDSAIPSSVEAFVQSHKEAYILSWKAGGFLPSASIAQTMVENGFNFTNPSGTSLWQAHNMGGVKTSSKSNFPVTLATFGDDSIDITGTKPGSSVGDNTGGAYTWFKDYNAGIVGKAEFMAHQTLYTGAINNTDGVSALTAIYKGGWATDPSYLMKLQSAYQNVGTKFHWLDQEAIEKHGKSPYVGSKAPGAEIPKQEVAEDSSDDEEGPCDLGDTFTGDQVVGENSAPTLSIPAGYEGKLTLPPPDNKNYAGNQYPMGQCTWGAFNRMAQIGKTIEWFSGDGGNGGMWGGTARARGYTVKKGEPKVGWAASFYGGLAGSTPPYGHIAVCEYVNDDGSILVSETNVVNPGSGTRSWRVISKETVKQVEFIQGGKK